MDKPRIPIGETLEKAVRAVGGLPVRELLPAHVNLPKNADYVFRRENVIGELKCFEHDLSDDDDFNAKLRSLYHGWVRRGLVAPRPASNFPIRLRDLPLECAHEGIDLIKPVVERRIRDASLQIKKTRKLLQMEDAHGLLILVNDGNYLLNHDSVLRFVARCLKGGQHSSIKWLIYFAANMPGTLPGERREVRVWASGPRNPGLKDIPGLSDLCGRLFNAWNQLESEFRDRPFEAIAGDPATLDMVQFREKT